jgi:hypothetical protein
MTVITVDDTDAHHARSVAAGAAIVSPPVDQPYGVREYGAGTRRASSGTFTRRWRSATPVSATRSPCHPRATPVVLTRDVVVSTKIPRFTGGSNARSRPRVPGDRCPEEHVVAVSWIISGWVSTSSCVWRALWHGRCRIPALRS